MEQPLLAATSDQLLALRDATLSINASLSLRETLQQIAAAAANLANARFAALGVPDETGERLAEFVTYGLSREAAARIAYRPQGHGLLGLVLREGRTLRLRNLAEHPEFAGFPAGHPPMTSFLGVPVMREGQLLGDLYLADKRGADEFSEADQFLIELVAANAAQAILNARAHTALRARRRELNALNAVTIAASQTQDLDAVLEVALRQATALYGVESLDLYLVARGSGQFVHALHRGPTPAPFLAAERAELAQGIMGQVASGRQPRIVRNLAEETETLWPTALAAGFISLACLPLIAPSGVMGTLNLFGRKPAQFESSDPALLESLCGQMGVAIENAQLHQQVAILAASQERQRAGLTLEKTQLRKQATTLAVSQERRRIGMDLHDNIIQSIYASGLGLELALTDLDREDIPTAKARIRRSVAELRTAVYDIRAYLLGLRRKRFVGQDLVAALGRLLREYQANTQIVGEMDADPTAGRALSDAARGALLLIAQEALSNTARHSQATRVSVKLAAEGDGVLLTIHDNGRGLSPQAPPATGGYGLRNMRERARALGGHVQIHSPASGGTEVRVRLPVTAI